MTEAVFRHLPDVYRRAGQEGTATWALLSELGRQVALLDDMADQVMRSRFFEYVNDLEDLERLAALFSLAPWPEEDKITFRERARQVAATFLRGAITPRSILELVAAASDAKLDRRSVKRVDNRTTRGLFRRNKGSATFTAEVVDMPDVWSEATVLPASDWFWEIDNRSYRDPGELNAAPSLPEPVVDIVAGSQPVVLPILVQRDLRRMVLVNRFIPPGATLRVDLHTMTVLDVAGPRSLLGPVRLNEKEKTLSPDLLFGTGGVIGDPKARQLSGPKTRPFHLLRWSNRARTGANLAEVPGPPGNLDPAPWLSMPWPPMLGWGRSNWRLMLGRNGAGQEPELDEVMTDSQVRTVPCPADGGPEQVIFRWAGGLPGTFSVRFPLHHLSGEAEPAPTAQPLPHRVQWLREQIDKARPAGVIYLDQSSPAMQKQLPAPQTGAPSLHLWETHRPEAGPEPAVATVPRFLEFTDAITAGDAAEPAIADEEESQ